MKKIWLLFASLIISGCAHDDFHLDVDNNLADAHGQSVYFRSSLRSQYAGQIRGALSKKFGEMGIKTATSAENADYIAIFDIETFYPQDGKYKNISLANTAGDQVLFGDDDESSSMYFSGNANRQVPREQTCFTLNIGRKGTSNVRYNSAFCAYSTVETEEMLPLVLDVYGKYATYKSANVGFVCLTSETGDISCSPMSDRQKEFINSLWRESSIVD